MAALTPLANVERLSERVLRVLGQNPGKFTLQGTNTYVVGTGRSRLLIDTGEGLPAYEALLSSVLKEQDCSLSAIAITHHHHDHVGGISQVRQVVGAADAAALPAHKYTVVGEDSQGYAELMDGQILKVEGATLQTVYSPGHAHDHCGFYLEEENALFSGDCILGEGTTVFTDLRLYMKSLESYRLLSPKVIYPGHGPMIQNGLAKVEEYIAHRNAREGQVVRFLEKEGPATAGAIVATLYAAYPTSLHQAAEEGILLHLKKLQEEGRVVEGVEGRWALITATSSSL